MTTTVQIPVELGGTNVPYNDGTGPYGMASRNGYGHATYLLPLISEHLAAMATRLTQASTAGSTAGATAGAAAAEPFADAAAASAAAALVSENAADASADAAASSAAAAAADAVLTAADRVQTGADVVTAGAYRDEAITQASTATAQANLAASSAASASSVAQQDLSGVTAAALHRSPNAVVAACVYDTSKDSDGGAWVERCTNTSWFQEALNGTWLAATSPAGFLTELDARSRGATLGTEVSPDPTFASSAGWTLNGSAGIASNTLTATAVGTSNAIATRSDPVGGNLALATAYQVTVVVGSLTAGAIQVRMGNTGTTLRTLSQAGTHTFTVNPGATGANISLYASGTTTGTVTRFSVKPVTANVTATGDFFQLATDGKFYSLNAGSGTTEVFRGNKAKFPRLAAVVAEAASVTIYDLTEPGRPMWMRFTGLGGGTSALRGSAAGVSAVGGALALAHNLGLSLVDFAQDRAFSWSSGGRLRYRGAVALRNGALGHDADDAAKTLPNNTVNAVAMTVLPDAPVDPVTGLQVPTIAAATASAVCVIRSDGTVVTCADANPAYRVRWDSRGGLWWDLNSSTTRHAVAPTTAGFTVVGYNHTGVGVTPAFPFNNNAVIGRSIFGPVSAIANSSGVSLLRHNYAIPRDGLLAYIAPTYNTGWMAGDIRRCWLASTATGVIGTGSEAVTTVDFTAGWTDVGAPTKATSSVTVAAAGGAYKSGLLVVGREYQFAVDVTVTGGSIFGLNNSQGASSPTLLAGGNANGTGVYSSTFVATDTGLYFRLGAAGSVTVNSISIKETAADRSYKAKHLTTYGTLPRTAVASGSQTVAYSGWSASNYLQEPYSADLDFGTGAWTCSALINYTTAVASTIVERAAASGARIVLGTDGTGKLTATAYDGTTTRTVTTTAAYNTATLLKARATYTTDGTLSISVNGRPVASTYGAPLLTLTNASAVCTIGNDRTLATPFPGSIALVKWGATVPTQEQMLWMYEQEKQMFRAGAQVTLPSSNSLLDVAYDDLTDTITVVDSGNEASFTGLVRTSAATVPAGTYSKVARGSGVKLLARITTTPGVDVTIPSQNLKEELKRTEDAARRARLPMTFDYVGGFTGNTTNGSTAIASVTGLSVPSTVNLRGVTVTGTGIPASTVITDIVGSTVYISKAATATNTGVSISMLEFPLPTGYEAEGVATAGTLKQEGSTKDFTRSFDGFTEKVVYGAAPGSTAWVQARARRQA